MCCAADANADDAAVDAAGPASVAAAAVLGKDVTKTESSSEEAQQLSLVLSKQHHPSVNHKHQNDIRMTLR